MAWAWTILFGAMSLFLIVGNPVAGIIARMHNKHYSFVPLLGGIFGVLCLLVCPIRRAHYFAWVPLILDYTFPAFLYAVFVLGAFRRK